MPYNNFGVSFNGKNIVHPGAYEYTDANGMVVSSSGATNIPILVGEGDSGEPGVVKWFTNATDARNYVTGGDLYTAINMLFSPAPEGGEGASIAGILVVNPLVAATLSKGGINFTAVMTGTAGNNIEVKVADGSLGVAGTKQIVAQRWDTGAMELYDNVGAVLKVTYTGADVYAAMSVATDGNGKAITFTTSIGADQASAVADLSVDLTGSRYETIADLVSYINSVSNYSAEFINYSSANTNTSSLDALTSVAITGTGGYATAVKADIENTLANSNLVTASVTGAITNFNYTNLAGGALGTTPSSWVTFFDSIKKEFSDMLVVLTDQASIHAEALTHIQEMESRKQRQLLFTGGGVGEDKDKAKQRATNLNNSRAVLAYPAVYYKPVNNGQTAIPAYFTAAMIAGRVAGVDPSQPITFDQFDLVDLENDLLSGDPDVDDLISAGVCTLERIPQGGIRVVEGITTYTGTNNPVFREISVRRGADDLSNIVTTSLESQFVGKKGIVATVSSVTTAMVDILEQAIKDELITAYDPKSIQVRIVNGVVYVDYLVAPVVGVNYILITTHFVPDIPVAQ
jgi:hypothetical protein